MLGESFELPLLGELLVCEPWEENFDSSLAVVKKYSASVSVFGWRSKARDATVVEGQMKVGKFSHSEFAI